MGELGVLSGAERRLEREKGDQPVLESCPLLPRGRAGQRFQPLVDLERIRRDGDWQLPEITEPVGQ
jgi:hypothetical protein